MSNWRPIETAPKDGTKILGYGQGRVEKKFRAVIEWMGEWVIPHDLDGYHDDFKATHWMPLPEAPK